MTKYFDEPTQVKFKDVAAEGEGARWIGGIGFENYIFCGECGKAIYIADYDDDDIIIKELPWISISEDIIGGDSND